MRSFVDENKFALDNVEKNENFGETHGVDDVKCKICKKTMFDTYPMIIEYDNE